MTDLEFGQRFSNAEAMYGPEHFVRKVEGRWMVEAFGRAHPGVFTTKREAVAATQAWALAGPIR